MEQWAQYVLDKMPEVYASSPRMYEQGFQIKAMVVLLGIQEVYDFAQILRARAKKLKTGLGHSFSIGAFFSLRAEKKVGGVTKYVTEREANNGAEPSDCDIIVTCKKYVTGYHLRLW